MTDFSPEGFKRLSNKIGFMNPSDRDSLLNALRAIDYIGGEQEHIDVLNIIDETCPDKFDIQEKNAIYIAIFGARVWEFLFGEWWTDE